INMFRIFTRLSSSLSANKLEAISVLNEIRNTCLTTKFTLQNTMITTVKNLLDVINGLKLLDHKALRNASLVDFSHRGNPIVKTLLEMGVKYSKKDIEFIRIGNKEAAELLENKNLCQSSQRLCRK